MQGGIPTYVDAIALSSSNSYTFPHAPRPALCKFFTPNPLGRCGNFMRVCSIVPINDMNTAGYMHARDLFFVIPTYRLCEVGETVQAYDEHFRRNGQTVCMLCVPAYRSRFESGAGYPALQQPATVCVAAFAGDVGVSIM
jgi:hypothetical protein